MQAKSDVELLRDYAWRHSEAAFAELVSRHIDLVYSAAMRHVGNHHQAQEIAQAVFVILARKARSLGSGTVLVGWLFQTARLTAANYLRTEIRRTRREQEAFMQSKPQENREDPWQQVAPHLNDAIAGLGEKDRNAIVLRYLKGKDFKEVGVALGASEQAAQMRVGRALEKLRKLFARRGVVLSATALGSVLAANGTQAAPVGLAASVASAAVHGVALTASTATLVKGTLKLMAWTKVQFTVGAGVLVLLAYQFHQNSAQGRQLAAARHDLQGQNDALAAVDRRIAELEQQTAAIADVRRSQAAELERLRARRAATPDVARANAALQPATLLSATLQDPDAREYLRRGLVNDCRSRYGPFFRQLKVDPDVAEKLIQLGGENGMKNLDALAAFTEGKMTADMAVQVEAESARDSTNQICQALGETGLAKFLDFARTRPAGMLMSQMDERLTWVYGFSSEQRARLTEVLQAEPPEAMRGLSGELTVSALVYPEQLTRWFEREAEVNQDILSRGAEFLTPDQIEIFDLMLRSKLSSQKQTALRLLRKF